MAVRIEIPEDIEHHLETQWGNLPRHALEALAIEGYRARVLSRSQVRRMLGFETGVEVDEFMKRAGVPFDYTMDDFEQAAAASGLSVDDVCRQHRTGSTGRRWKLPRVASRGAESHAWRTPRVTETTRHA